MKTQRAPCETAVWHILPAIRSQVAKELVKFGLSQKDISERLGITQPAVSQYVTSKRGTNVALSNDARVLIRSLAQDVAGGGDVDLNVRVCEICTCIKGDDACVSFR
ncbi:MAG: helix-turn-helix domain-containing protein [Euryarchaeota archaeon]|nr:helix-turn-helix domain-containing protein [Euryarchaeota archaeon]